MQMKAVSDFIELQDSGKWDKNPRILEDFRNKYKYKRGIDGRVSVKGSKGWYEMRLDMGVSGTVLLRQETSSELFLLEADQLKQVDLSDDKVVLLMFADGSWEKVLVPLEAEVEPGKVEPVKLTKQEFRDIFSVLGEEEEEEAVQADAGKANKK